MKWIQRSIKHIYHFIIDLYKRIIAHEVLGLSAQLAYFFLLSLFPLLITIFSFLPYLPIQEHDILLFLEDFAPAGTLELISKTLSEILNNHNGSLLSAGIIATIWSASAGMNNIIRALNRAYEVKENRPFYIVRPLSAALTVIMIFVFVIALLLPVFGKHIGILLSNMFGVTEQFLKVWNNLRIGLSIIILLVVFSVLYLLVPNKKMSEITFLPGAIFSTIGWMTVSAGFSYYVGNFANYTITYGSLGVIIILMIWLYLSGIIILVGGEINAIRDQWKKNHQKNEIT